MACRQAARKEFRAKCKKSWSHPAVENCPSQDARDNLPKLHRQIQGSDGAGDVEQIVAERGHVEFMECSLVQSLLSLNSLLETMGRPPTA